MYDVVGVVIYISIIIFIISVVACYIEAYLSKNRPNWLNNIEAYLSKNRKNLRNNITNAKQPPMLKIDKIYCRSCNTINLKTSKFCKKCGKLMQVKHCPKCQLRIEDDADFCTSCGIKL